MAKKKTTKKEVQIISYPMYRYTNGKATRKLKYQKSYEKFTKGVMRYPTVNYTIPVSVVKDAKGNAVVEFNLLDVKNPMIRKAFALDAAKKKYCFEIGRSADFGNTYDTIVITRVK